MTDRIVGAEPRNRSVERRAWAAVCAVRAAAGRLAALVGWRRWLAAFVAGALSMLALPPAGVSPVLFLTLPALFWLIDSRAQDATATDAKRSAWQSMRRAAVAGWFFGFGYHLTGLYWIGSAFLVEADRFAIFMPFAVMAMPAGLALFMGIGAAAASLLRGPLMARVAWFAVALAAAEWLRGTVFTGFPWNVLGYAATSQLVLMQSAGVVGIYGLTLLAVWIATLPLTAAATPGFRWRSRPGATVIAATAGPVLIALGYGSYQLAKPMPPDVAGVRLRLVQPSIRQADKFLVEKRLDIFLRHLALTTNGTPNNPASLAGITHVVWPEASMPFLALRSQEAMSRIADALPDNVTLIAGTLRLEGPISPKPGEAQYVFNTAIAIDGAGNLAGLYDKLHLVPFGEYLPFQNLLSRVGFEHLTRQRGGFTAGAGPRRPMRIAGLPQLAMLICYEVVFPHAARLADGRPQVLVNLTNDAWFGRTSGPHQHFHQARVRAAELGVPMIRVANNGISGVVDARGRVRERLALNAAGVIDTPLPAAISGTIYSGLGDWIFSAMVVFFAVSAAACAKGFIRTK